MYIRRVKLAKCYSIVVAVEISTQQVFSAAQPVMAMPCPESLSRLSYILFRSRRSTSGRDRQYTPVLTINTITIGTSLTMTLSSPRRRQKRGIPLKQSTNLLQRLPPRLRHKPPHKPHNQQIQPPKQHERSPFDFAQDIRRAKRPHEIEHPLRADTHCDPGLADARREELRHAGPGQWPPGEIVGGDVEVDQGDGCECCWREEGGGASLGGSW